MLADVSGMAGGVHREAESARGAIATAAAAAAEAARGAEERRAAHARRAAEASAALGAGLEALPVRLGEAVAALRHESESRAQAAAGICERAAARAGEHVAGAAEASRALSSDCAARKAEARGAVEELSGAAEEAGADAAAGQAAARDYAAEAAREEPPTGETPTKREFEFPTALARTKPHDFILERFRSNGTVPSPDRVPALDGSPVAASPPPREPLHELPLNARIAPALSSSVRPRHAPGPPPAAPPDAPAQSSSGSAKEGLERGAAAPAPAAASENEAPAVPAAEGKPEKAGKSHRAKYMDGQTKIGRGGRPAVAHVQGSS
eukprot:tig00020848_g14583.t1